MAKPRIFISSTCFDLNDIRSELTEFLENYNFEVINSQLPSFGVSPKVHSHTACLDQVNNADFLILIIGRRYGGTFIGSEKSITNEEYKLAIKRGIPIIIFVNKQVDNSILFYKKNQSSDFSSIVDDTRIFHFIDYVKSASEDNWIHLYENIIDIKNTLKSQFSYYLLLLSKSCVKEVQKEKSIDSSKLSFVKFPSSLDKLENKKLNQKIETALRNGLKELHNVISEILLSGGKNDNKIEKLKAIWVIAKYGELNYYSNSIKLNNNLFKDYAWSNSKGKRVSDQMKPFNVYYLYDEELDENGNINVNLYFKNESDDTNVIYALTNYISDLIEQFGDDEAFEQFKKGDFRIYSN